jgi:DNA polymerase III subunit beta
MRIEIHLPQFKKMISLAEKITKKNTTLPVLSCIIFEIKKNLLVIKSTNLDVGVEISIPAKSDTDGVIAVPAHTISSFISQISDQDGVVKMELVSGNLHLTSARSKVVIKTVSPEDFPSIPRVSDGNKTIISADIFLKGLKSVYYSASISSVKPELSSVYIYKNGEYLVFAATDSFRLAEKKVKIPKTTTFEDTLIPFKNIADIIRAMEDIGVDITIHSNKNLISFDANGIYLTSRIVDGTFPDYQQIIPKNYSTEIVALKQDVIDAIKVSNVFTDKFNQIKFIVDPKGKKFEIQTKNADIGENATAVDAALSGEKVEINFNGKYISDGFQSIDADSVTFQLVGLNKPMVIRPASGDGTFMYLVMPMNR